MAALDYPWLGPLWRQWVAARQQQGLPHAIGLPWQPEAGSKELLDALVAWLLCQQPGKSACGQCKSCLLHKAGNHPDTLRVAPEEGKRIGVDRIRELQDKVWQRSNQSGATVVVIEKAELMTEAAANALLKTLEEPPEHNYLIVCPERFSRLLPTVRSRLTVYPLPRPSLTDIQHWLERHSGQAVTDPSLLSEAQMQPVTVLERLQSGIGVNNDICLAMFRGEPANVPDKGPEQLLWLDEFLRCLIRGARAAAFAQAAGQVSTSAEADQEWQIFLTTYPHLATKLPIWYDRALAIKRQLQGSGVNGKNLIQQLLSVMYMNSIQIEVE
ncbi:hypothetical protein [Aliidiomarina quisquiliarum]|uniref:hypothetical protein n=1 Tax=Aliidiomarina quisquiliarum TaxID=2938947 RepID=UPI00208ED805|nr:hypothetical protein [Aliidiomarina quisquiliarum]MCO4320836.1 hypothetical protein [Aliidiomarina quisquiliarum]